MEKQILALGEGKKGNTNEVWVKGWKTQNSKRNSWHTKHIQILCFTHRKKALKKLYKELNYNKNI